MKLAIVTILKRYKLALTEKHQVVPVRRGTIAPQGGIKMKLIGQCSQKPRLPSCHHPIKRGVSQGSGVSDPMLKSRGFNQDVLCLGTHYWLNGGNLGVVTVRTVVRRSGNCHCNKCGALKQEVFEYCCTSCGNYELSTYYPWT